MDNKKEKAKIDKLENDYNNLLKNECQLCIRDTIIPEINDKQIRKVEKLIRLLEQEWIEFAEVMEEVEEYKEQLVSEAINFIDRANATIYSIDNNANKKRIVVFIKWLEENRKEIKDDIRRKSWRNDG